MFSRVSQNSGRGRDMLGGLLIITLAFLGCLALSLWAKSESTPEPPRAPEPPTTVELVGFPSKVKPFELLARAQGMTPRTLFRGFVAEGLLPDGTLDFNRKGTALTYSFQSPPGLGPQPAREGGTLPRHAYCGKQNVRVTKLGIALEPDVTDLPCSGKGPEALELPEACGPEQIWAIAKKRKLKGSVARLEYYESRRGPAFRFGMGRDNFAVSAKDCKKVLSSKDQRGHVP